MYERKRDVFQTQIPLVLIKSKMAGIQALVNAYGEDSDLEGNDSPTEEITEDHTAHLKPGSSIDSLKSKFQLNVAPTVINKVRKWLKTKRAKSVNSLHVL